MTHETIIDAAIRVAQLGLDAGELPIGAVVVLGDDMIAEAFTQERALGRRLVHAELLALTAADQHLGWRPRDAPLVLASTLEPCLMCVGAAMTMRVDHVVFGLDSPGDGGTDVAARWHNHPDAPFFRAPAITGGLRTSEIRTQFRTYADQASSPGMRAWAQSLAGVQ